MKKNAVTKILAVMLVLAMMLAGCGQSADSSELADLQARIAELEEENNDLRQRLSQYETVETESQDSTEQTGNTPEETLIQLPVETEDVAVSDNNVDEEPQDEDKMQIVVFGDSIWDGSRDDSGIAQQVANYMNADVYNCAIGGTTASLKEYEDPNRFEGWTSCSLIGMINIMKGEVSTDILGDYMARGVMERVDFSNVDCFILAYGMNDYLSGAPISYDDQKPLDPRGYAGALRFAVDAIRNQYGDDIKILIVSPNYAQFYKDGRYETDGNMRNNGYGTLYNYAQAAESVATSENTLYVDAYNTMGIDAYTAEEYLEDGIHLSEEGRALYAKAIASCLKYGKPGQVSGNSYYY